MAIAVNYRLRGNIPVPGTAPGALPAGAWPTGRPAGRQVRADGRAGRLGGVAVTFVLVRRLMCLAHRTAVRYVMTCRRGGYRCCAGRVVCVPGKPLA